MAQAKLPLSMLRVSNAEETRSHLKLAGHENLVRWLEKYLALRGNADGKCMITFGVTGQARACAQNLAEAKRRIGAVGGVHVGTLLGKKWEESRFRSPYLRHGLWEHGYAVDTLETCVDWTQVPDTVANIEQAIRDNCGDDGKVHVFTHLSHLYPQGCAIYTTYVFRCSATYDEPRTRWAQMKKAASDVIAAMGGTISHQHGVGRDHTPWLKHEKTEQGIAVLETLARHFDPTEQMNPGCLLGKNSFQEK